MKSSPTPITVGIVLAVMGLASSTLAEGGKRAKVPASDHRDRAQVWNDLYAGPKAARENASSLRSTKVTELSTPPAESARQQAHWTNVTAQIASDNGTQGVSDSKSPILLLSFNSSDGSDDPARSSQDVHSPSGDRNATSSRRVPDAGQRGQKPFSSRRIPPVSERGHVQPEMPPTGTASSALADRIAETKRFPLVQPLEQRGAAPSSMHALDPPTTVQDVARFITSTPAIPRLNELQRLQEPQLDTRPHVVQPGEQLDEHTASVGLNPAPTSMPPSERPLTLVPIESHSLLAVGRSSPSPSLSVAAAPAFESRSITAETAKLRLAPATFHRLRVKAAIERIDIADRQVCAVFRQTDREIDLIAKRDGETTVTIHHAASRVPEIYLIKVRAEENENRDVEGDVQLQKLVAEMFPNTKIKITPIDKSLVVTGAVSSESEALSVVSFVRSLRLIPVVDQLKVQR